MRAKGNGDPAVCANNLVRISRGEVPYDRIRGVKFADLIGTGMTAQDDLAEDTAWMVGCYEPRVNVAGVTVRTDDAKMGGVMVDVDINGGTA